MTNLVPKPVDSALNFRFSMGNILSSKDAFEHLFRTVDQRCGDYFDVATYTVNPDWKPTFRPRRIIIGCERTLVWPYTEVKVLPNNHAKLYLAYKEYDKIPVMCFIGSANFVGTNQLYDILYCTTRKSDCKDVHTLYQQLWGYAQDPVIIRAPKCAKVRL